MMSDSIRTILIKYYNLQESKSSIDEEKVLSDKEKELMVSELIDAYNGLSVQEKVDLMVPAKAEFVSANAIIHDDGMADRIDRYVINYRWPPNDGFEGMPKKTVFMEEEEYDRVGGTSGHNLSPLKADGMPASYLERAIPYYIPEADITKSPSYHRYRVKAYNKTGEEITALRGVVAQAFWQEPDDGGGEQVKVTESIKNLKRRDRNVYLEEI